MGVLILITPCSSFLLTKTTHFLVTGSRSLLPVSTKPVKDNFLLLGK